MGVKAIWGLQGSGLSFGFEVKLEGGHFGSRIWGLQGSGLLACGIQGLLVGRDFEL